MRVFSKRIGKFAISKVATVLAGSTAFDSGATEPPVLSAPPPPDMALSAPSNESGGLILPVPSGIWKDDGNGFCKGATEVEVSLGASVGNKIFGSTDAHDLALMKLSVGRVINDVEASDRWYGGNWELMGEVFGGEQFKPYNAHLAGLTALLRYDFATGTKWVPFIDAGGGVTETDIGIPDLGGTFQFNLQGGIGVHWFVRKDLALTAEYRFLHISSASTERPNHGVNTSAFYVGISWFF